VIGSREFVEELIQKLQERFGPTRKDGARKWLVTGEAAAGGAVECEGFEEGDLRIERKESGIQRSDTREGV
jgi:hypothetical protein